MTADFRAARVNMVESQVRTSDVTDIAIQDAMFSTPREALLPPEQTALAYADAEVDYAPGRKLMRPRDIGKLLQAMLPKAGERALAIAAPYGAALLEAMGLSVDRVDGDDLLKVLAGAYDVILCEGAVSETPQAWIAALAPGGRLGVVQRVGAVGKARVYVNVGGRVASHEAFDCQSSLMPEFRPEPRFAF